MNWETSTSQLLILITDALVILCCKHMWVWFRTAIVSSTYATALTTSHLLKDVTSETLRDTAGAPL